MCLDPSIKMPTRVVQFHSVNIDNCYSFSTVLCQQLQHHCLWRLLQRRSRHRRRRRVRLCNLPTTSCLSLSSWCHRRMQTILEITSCRRWRRRRKLSGWCNCSWWRRRRTKLAMDNQMITTQPCIQARQSALQFTSCWLSQILCTLRLQSHPNWPQHEWHRHPRTDEWDDFLQIFVPTTNECYPEFAISKQWTLGDDHMGQLGWLAWTRRALLLIVVDDARNIVDAVIDCSV